MRVSVEKKKEAYSAEGEEGARNWEMKEHTGFRNL